MGKKRRKQLHSSGQKGWGVIEGRLQLKYGGLLDLTKPVMFEQGVEGGEGFGKVNGFHVKALWVGYVPSGYDELFNDKNGCFTRLRVPFHGTTQAEDKGPSTMNAVERLLTADRRLNEPTANIILNGKKMKNVFPQRSGTWQGFPFSLFYSSYYWTWS